MASGRVGEWAISPRRLATPQLRNSATPQLRNPAMLKQVLQEIETVNAPITLQALSRRLKIEPSALQGMIDFWVRKGRLHDDDAVNECAPDGGCGPACGGAASCAFVVDTPRSYSLRL